MIAIISFIINYLNDLNMNKNSFLLILASLMVMSASAQTRSLNAGTVPERSLEFTTVRPQARVQQMQMCEPGTTVAWAPRQADAGADVWYRRPAGAFPANFAIEDGVMLGLFNSPFFSVKPFSDYTFNGYTDGLDPDAYCWWENVYGPVDGKDLTTMWEYEAASLPIFHAGDYSVTAPGHGYRAVGSSSILSMPSTVDAWGYDLLKSSRSFDPDDSGYLITYYSGAEPFKDNKYGWWFGKNGYHNLASPPYFVDGIAQAFEKPEHPYLLKQAVLYCGLLTVAPNTEVEMHCSIYKLDRIPDYNDDTSAILPDEPGELIAQGRAIVTPKTYNETGGLVSFDFYEQENGSEHQVFPTIESAILVVIDGYNEMDNLTDFSAMINASTSGDEGFGELAYIKFGRPNEDGGIDYVWRGLDNFFNGPHMRTGLTIFLTTELPFLTFNAFNEDGYYEFPKEGGLMEKVIDEIVFRSIEFFSWVPSADGAWEITCDGGDIPDWLSIELTDDNDDGEFTGVVTAEVVAAPLPAGVSYRKAVVRFGFPGAYVDYTFSQCVNVGIDEQLDNQDAVVVGYYDIMGRQLPDMQPGLNIVKMSDGTARKVIQK